MKLIYNFVMVDAINEEGLLINTLTSDISVITKEEKAYIQKWEDEESITPINEKEEKFYQELLENGFLIENNQEEIEKEKEILEYYRKCHQEVARDRTGVIFVITYKCNFACPYCYEEASSYEGDKIMSKKMVDKIFEIHKNKIDNIAFYGGEPFLPESKEIIEYIISKAPNASYAATTNGFYLSDYIKILKDIRIENIMVTLDGPKELHNKTRVLRNGEGTFDQVERGIVDCLRNEIPIKIRMNISEHNLNECLQLRENFIERFSTEFKKGILMFEMQPIFQLNDTQKTVLKDKLYYRWNGENGSPTKYNAMTYSVSPIMKNFVSPFHNKMGLKYCNCDAESRRLLYDAEGNIYSCMLSLRKQYATVGQYYPEYYLKENSMLSRTIESVKECSNCKLKFLCGGGCANGIITSEGDVMKPNCTAIKNEIYYELPLMYKSRIEGLKQ